jgi:hypothetical protein
LRVEFYTILFCKKKRKNETELLINVYISFCLCRVSFYIHLSLASPLQNSLTIFGVFGGDAAQHNAALNRNQELSVNAPEFIPKFSAPLGDWGAHQHHPEAPSQVYPPQVFAQNSRPFPPQQQQIPFAQQPHQRPPHYVYQQNRSFGQNSRPDLVQNQHHNHHPNYSNHQQQGQHLYMMNQQGGPHQMGNNYHGGSGSGGGGGGGGHQRGGIQNRLNFNAANADPVPVEPLPHKQVS